MKQEMMHKETVQMFNARRYTYIFVIAALFSSLSLAHAADSQNKSLVQDSPSGIISTNQDGEIVISTGNGEPFTSSHITKSQNTFFCHSNTFETLVERRLDETNEGFFKAFNVTSSYNGQKVDIFKGQGLSEEVADFFHIGVDLTCSTKEMSIFFIGYNDSTTQSGSTLLHAKIDLVTGVVK